jgi:GTP-binding protein
MFVDQVKVTLRAGKGGNGCVSFRRERGVPRGGPDGGRGGDGGSIYLISAQNLHTLAFFRFHPINKARKGAHGEGGNRQGKRGKDLSLQVPVGTIVKEKDGDAVLFDFVSPDQKFLIVRGGKGGRGNASFASSIHRAPREWKEGQEGEEKEFILELKLIADVGLVGFPNVGKSTLISRISAAKPAIADYPFTTLIPNLGVVDVDELRSFVIADIPGLIDGAHLGHGLGTQFLKHVERTKILLHLVDISPYTERDPVQDYKIVMRELESFSPELIKRQQILAVNKIDLLKGKKNGVEEMKKLARKEGIPFFAISALKKEGLAKMVEELAKTLDKMKENSE